MKLSPEHKKCPICFSIVNPKYKTCKSCEQITSASRKTITLAELRSKIGASRTHTHVRSLNRQWNKGMLPSECENCGYHKFTELCHIKPVAAYPPSATLGEINAMENNIVLCPNCHKEFDHGLLDMAEIITNSMVRNG